MGCVLLIPLFIYTQTLCGETKGLLAGIFEAGEKTEEMEQRREVVEVRLDIVAWDPCLAICRNS